MKRKRPPCVQNIVPIENSGTKRGPEGGDCVNNVRPPLPSAEMQKTAKNRERCEQRDGVIARTDERCGRRRSANVKRDKMLLKNNVPLSI